MPNNAPRSPTTLPPGQSYHWPTDMTQPDTGCMDWHSVDRWHHTHLVGSQWTLLIMQLAVSMMSRQKSNSINWCIFIGRTIRQCMVCYGWSLVIGHSVWTNPPSQTVLEILGLKDLGVLNFTFWSHITLYFMTLFNSKYLVLHLAWLWRYAKF